MTRSIAYASARVAAQLVPYILLLAAITPALAQSRAIPQLPTDGSISGAEIQASIDLIAGRDDLDEGIRTSILAELREAQAQVQAIASAVEATASFTSALDTAPAETERLRAQLDDVAAEPADADRLGISEGMTLSELEQILARESAAAASADTDLNELDSGLAALQDQPAAARARINELRGIIDQLSIIINSEPPAGENPMLTDARKLNAALRRDARTAETNRLEQALLSHGVRLELLRAQRDVAQADANRARQRVELAQTIVNGERQAAARQAELLAAEAQLATADKHPTLRAVAEVNLELTRELPTVAEEIPQATAQLAQVQREAQNLQQAMTRSRQRLEIGGVTQATGQLFVEERRNLPRFSEYRTEVRDRRKTLATIGLAQVQIEEQRRELTSIESRVDELMQDVATDLTDPDELRDIRNGVDELLRERRELLNQSASSYRSYIRVLGDLDVAQRQLLEIARDYREFLDQNLIWIPNTSPINPDTLKDLPRAIAWLLSPSGWVETGSALSDAIEEYSVEAALLLLVLAVSVLLQPALLRMFRSLDAKLGRLSTDSILLTLGALGIAATRALPLPLILGITGLALERSPSSTGFTVSVSAAFLTVAPFLYNLTLFRVLSARKGILGRHFNWRQENLVEIRRQLDRVIVIGAPIVFVTVIGLSSDVPSYRHSLGRLAFVALMLLFVAAAWPLGHPHKSVGSNYYARRPNTWLSRLKWLWFSLDVGIPLFLASLALIGFLYTAAILTDKFVETFWLVLGIVLVNLVIRRWLALERRKIEWKVALERRESKRSAKEKQSVSEEEDDDPQRAMKRMPLDLDAVGQQTTKLLQAGMFVVGILGTWGIWSEVLPALSVLDEVTLWTQTITVDGVETTAPVTLNDVLLALVIAIATLVASKNLPGLMEIAVLRHLHLKPGSRYTINTLLRYAVVTIGVVSILSIIGWNWSRIQWLVAALSVGLGFGLQEIVANFVSGLIILFERPVRVGDTVTVGQLTGSVSRVRIRATTITDWDRKEIIVPNKSFITEQVVNWTLSDPITRIVIPVGISYGSDVTRAKRVMEDTLAALPLVLDEPAPSVYFMGFGDSSLNFNLYVYSRQLSERLPLTDAVHAEILTALRKNGIEIPFPQRDLHVRSVTDDLKGTLGKAPDE